MNEISEADDHKVKNMTFKVRPCSFKFPIRIIICCLTKHL